MADIKLTTEQQSVVDARECSLLVAAAAGSGKTAVLVKRIIEKILAKDHPADISRLLIVTFTKAAAAEMRERIGRAIADEIKKDPDNEYLKAQAALLPNAAISTIDSFCSTIVKENFQEVDIDPGFVIADSGESDLLKEDILNDIFEEEYAGKKADFMEFLSFFGTYKDDAEAKKRVTELYDFAENETDPIGWLAYAEKLAADELPKEFIALLTDEFSETVENAIAICDKAYGICRAYALTGYEKTMSEDAELLEGLRGKALDFDTVVSLLSALKFPTLSRNPKKDEPDPDAEDEVKTLRDIYRKNLKKLKEDYFFAQLSVQNDICLHTAPAVLALIRITREFIIRTEEEKRTRNSYEFSDIAHFAHRILCTVSEDGKTVIPTDAARETAGRYDEIMIDEYQDSSYIQEDILKAVSGEFGEIPNMFMVGDVKQSIYSFRQARPDLFIGKYENFNRDTGHRKTDLSMNFRSRRAVLDSINVLLAPVMKKSLSQIEYDEAAALYFGSSAYTADTKENETEVMLIDDMKKLLPDENEHGNADDTEDPGGSDEEIGIGNAEIEALAVGQRILLMINEGYTVSAGNDPKTGEPKTRPVTFGDFAILLRKTKGVSDLFVKVFTKLGIPADAETATGFYETVEIRKTLAFLRILDNPYEDIPFAAVLHSYFGNYSSDDLAKLRADFGAGLTRGKQRFLYSCVKLSAEAGDEKALSFLRLYDLLHEAAETLTVHEVIEKVIGMTGYADYVTTLDGGERRRGNLDILVAEARKYEKSTYVGLHDFLRYIDRFLRNMNDIGEAVIDSAGDRVKIMSIHKSKGLEFPVVFVSLCGDNFNKKDVQQNMIISSEFGIGTHFVDVGRRTRRKTIKQKALQRIKLASQIAEELRIFYVALTRAKEKLLITATVKDLDKRLTEWKTEPIFPEAPARSAFLGSKNFVDFIRVTLFSGMTPDELSELIEHDTCTRTLTRHSGKIPFTSSIGVSIVRSFLTVAPAGTDDEEDGEEESEENGTAVDLFDIPGVRDEYEAQKAYAYPYLEEAKAPVRVSVSELKHIEIENLRMQEDSEFEPEELRFETEEKTEIIPRFMMDAAPEKAVGALRGTLYHEVFEKLTYSGDLSTEESTYASVKEDIERLIEKGYLEKDITDTVSPKKIAAFVRSAIGKRMAEAERAGKLKREQAFVYRLGPDEYRKYAKTDTKNDSVMVQGIIDAYFEEDGQLVLVDYKTDKVYTDAASELVAKYRVQLELYAEALEKLTGKKVKEKVIYSVSKDEVIVF